MNGERERLAKVCVWVVTLRVKSLDPEDRRILYENLWDLYVTDDGNLTGHTGEGT